MNERDTLRKNACGHLEIGGCDAVELARQYGTPLYVLDEAYVRRMARVFRSALSERYGDGLVLYASKALCCKEIYRIAMSEGLGADVVSGGELYTALSVGFPADKIYFHGNNKTRAEIEQGIAARVGCFVVDGFDEIEFLNDLAGKAGVKQRVLLRVNPGVEAHTHHYIQTARLDSKFGLAVRNGSAEEGVKRILAARHLSIAGFHCHIGSQIFEREAFAAAADKMTDFMRAVRARLGYSAEELNLGGGYGVWYAEGDARISAEEYGEFVRVLAEAVLSAVRDKGLDKPRLTIEPGRAMVAEAGVTLYTAGNRKNIEGVRRYVSVDGGMFENPRYALYQSKYTAVCANKLGEPHTVKTTIAGKCCESGDRIIDEAYLPDVERGDILAVFTTGAYNFSMASNYNRNLVPPIVKVADGKSCYMVRPETYEDLIRRDE